MVRQTPAQIASVYVNYLKAFNKRADVMNGKRISYHDNQDPDGNLRDENWVNYGDARVTTGFCVSVSQAILKDELFQILLQSRGALAKIISIDIKEQFYGYCKPSYVQNKWHSAILVRDSGINLVLDPTCAQFGNQFVDKFVWDFETWEKTFRSPVDTHDIKGFNDNVLSFAPEAIRVLNYEQAIVKVQNALHDITTIDDVERQMIADFFLQGIEVINRKLQMGNLTDNDFKYMNTINTLMKQFNFKQSENEYFVMKFISKDSALKWIARFVKDDCILPIYVTTSKSLKEACDWFGFDINQVNIEAKNDETYIVLKFENIVGCDLENILDNVSTFIPYGMKIEIDTTIDIYNGGKILSETSYGIEKKTNTIYINCNLL